MILGSMKRWGEYSVLSPHMINPALYLSDHEAAYKLAQAVFYPAIEKADVVLVYAPDGVMGDHTKEDVDYAISIGKKPILIRDLAELSEQAKCLKAVRALLDEHCLKCGVTDGHGRRSCDDHIWREKAVDRGNTCTFRRLRWLAGEKIVITYMDGKKEEWKPNEDGWWFP